MKKLLVVLLIVCGCNTEKYYQSFEAGSKEKLKIENGYYTFENDSVKIIYDFFAENGKMSFVVSNKKSVPLYIDWNKSSLIVNKGKVAYWSDKIITKSRFKSATRYYEAYPSYPVIYGEYFFKREFGLSESIASRPERITVIPPSAQWYKVEYDLCDVDIYPQAPYKKVNIERTHSTSGKTIKGEACAAEFFSDKSPFVFSNFLTLSYSENFANEFYFTNQFYVSRIIEMDKRFYKGMMVNRDFNYPYSTPITFLKLVPYKLTMEYNDETCEYIYKTGHRCSLPKMKSSNFCHSHSK